MSEERPQERPQARDIAIRVEGLSKRFHLGERQPYRRLGESLVRNAKRLVGRGGPKRSKEILWALKDVNFSVEAGEIVGIIGANGAGKTTLLKILAKISLPTEGRAEIYGQVGSLLEVGTGFHQELTGRENVFLNGAILGMPNREIQRKYNEIVEFAQIPEFMDTPVKHYSSGMRVRLAFSVAAFLEPEILFIDEVLSVGDAEFQAKCLRKMQEVAGAGRTVIFVSHNMGAISTLCTRCMWIDHGTVRMDGSPTDVVEAYLSEGHASGTRWEHPADADCGRHVKVTSVEVERSDGTPSASIPFEEPTRIRLEVDVARPAAGVMVAIHISDMSGMLIIATSNRDVRDNDAAGDLEPGQHRFTTQIPGALLRPGRYMISAVATIQRIKLDEHEYVLAFDIMPRPKKGRRGIIMPLLAWEREDAVTEARTT